MYIDPNTIIQTSTKTLTLNECHVIYTGDMYIHIHVHVCVICFTQPNIVIRGTIKHPWLCYVFVVTPVSFCTIREIYNFQRLSNIDQI